MQRKMDWKKWRQKNLKKVRQSRDYELIKIIWGIGGGQKFSGNFHSMRSADIIFGFKIIKSNIWLSGFSVENGTELPKKRVIYWHHNIDIYYDDILTYIRAITGTP